MKPRVLDRYVAGRFIAVYGATLAAFTLLYVLVDSVSQYGSLADNSKSFLDFLKIWLRFYAAQVPVLFCRVLGPVAVAAGAAFTVTLFQRTNELVPILSAGISLRRQAAPILILAGAMVLASAAVQELWIPAHLDEMREAKSPGRGKSVIRHVKYFDSKRRVLIAVKRYLPKTVEGQGILVFAPPAGGARGILAKARSIAWEKEETKGDRSGRWVLRDVTLQVYDRDGSLIPPGGNPGEGSEATGDPAAGRLLRAYESIHLDELAEVEVLPPDLDQRESQEAYVRIGEILRQIEKSADPHRWKVRLFSRIVDPLHGMILVLLCIPTILSRGTRNIFLSAISITVVASLYFVVSLFAANLGNRGTLPPGLAVGLAPLLFGSLGITLYIKMPS